MEYVHFCMTGRIYGFHADLLMAFMFGNLRKVAAFDRFILEPKCSPVSHVSVPDLMKQNKIMRTFLMFSFDSHKSGQSYIY